MAHLTIGEIARRAGIQASAIRFYEEAGLLPRPVRVSGQRRYSEAALDRLALLQFAKAAGFTLAEIRRLFQGSREGQPPPERWRKFAHAKLAELDENIRGIQGMKMLLSRVLECQCLDLEECGRAVRRARSTLPGPAR